MNDKPKKIYVTYEQDGAGNLSIKRVVTLAEDRVTNEEYDPNKHNALITEFLKDNGVRNIEEAETLGIFARFDEAELTREVSDNFLGVETEPTPSAPTTEEEPAVEETPESDPVVETPEEPTNPYGLDDDDQYTDGEVAEDHKTLKRVGMGVLTGAAVVGMLAGVHSCTQQQVDEQKEENEDDLYKNMTEEQRAFFEPTFKAVEAFNKRASEDGTFKLDEDSTTLHITAYEAIALNIIMNDYSSDELYSIIGTLDLDTSDIMNLARSAYSKLSTYYMNAKAPSGLSQIISDENARAFFERHENAVIEFNNNPSTELSDKVIKGLYYDYVHGGAEGAYAKIENDGVAWLATSAGFGFELANRNVEEFLRINNVSEEEIAEYGKAAVAVGMPLSKVTTSDLLTGINEEIDLDILDEIDNKSLCAAVTMETREKVEALKLKQQIAVTIVRADAKGRLVEGLQNLGANSLANKVMVSDINISEDLLEEIRAHNASANGLVDDYTARISSTTDKEALVVAVMELAQEKYGLTSEIDIPNLVNNRFRTLEKEKTQTQNQGTIPTVDENKFNNLNSEEKKDYIRDNGAVIDTTTTTTEVQVQEEDLTAEEKKDVVSQEAILEAVDALHNVLVTQGAQEANAYTEEEGAYDYNNRIVNPYNNEVINTDDLSLFNIVAHATAFGDGATNINSSDAQIQNRMDADSEDELLMLNKLTAEEQAYLKSQYGSNWKIEFFEDTYEDAYTQQIDGSLKVARQKGEELKKSAKEAYEKAQAEINRTNSQTQTPTPTVPTTPEPSKPVTTPTTGTTEQDPNIGEQFGEDEIPFVPSSPVSYISDADWDLAFSNEPIEQSTGAKTK